MTSGQERKTSMFRRVVTIFKDRFGVGVSSNTPAAGPAMGSSTTGTSGTSTTSSTNTNTASTTIDFSTLAAAVTVLEGIIARVEQHAHDQVTSKAQIGADARGLDPSRKELFVHLRSAAGVARTLKAQVPGISLLAAPSAKVRAESLITEAEAFARNAQIYQSVLIDHGMPSDFVTQLSAATAAYKNAVASAGTARSAQRGATAGLKSEIALGEQTVRQLDANLNRMLRNSPADLAAWKSARRVTQSTSTVAVPAGAPGQSVESATAVAAPASAA